VKLDNSGSVTWRKLYNGSASGAVAIAVAPDGSIYVTASSANKSGGTDITTIKYVQEPTIQPLPGGAMLLQLPGLPACMPAWPPRPISSIGPNWAPWWPAPTACSSSPTPTPRLIPAGITAGTEREQWFDKPGAAASFPEHG